MGKSSKRHLSSKKAIRSSSSPARSSSVKSFTANKHSRSRSRTRGNRTSSRSRSTSRNRNNNSPKKAAITSQTVKKFNNLKVDPKEHISLHHDSDNHTDVVHKINSHNLPSHSDNIIRRRSLTSRVLEPLHPSNMMVRGSRLNRRLFAHCRRHSRFYTSMLILALMTLGLGYSGYTVEQMIQYARTRVNMITAHIKKHR